MKPQISNGTYSYYNTISLYIRTHSDNIILRSCIGMATAKPSTESDELMLLQSLEDLLDDAE